MDTREIAAEYRLTHWAQIMQERAASGQSIREYCKEIGCGEHVYYYWQKKLREAACQELLPMAEASSRATPQGWMVCSTQETRPVSCLAIEIGEYRIVVSADVDTEALKKVCKLLSSIC